MILGGHLSKTSFRVNPLRGGGGQQPLQSLEKFKKYKGGRKYDPRRENHSTVDSLLFSLHIVGFDSQRNSMIQHTEYNQTSLTYQSITSGTDHSNAPSRQQILIKWQA
jgi:hypothetical protein